MVRSCCVNNCKAEWNPNTHLSFYSFPIKNEALANQWKAAIPCKGTLKKYSYICSDHFDESDFRYMGGKRYLNKTAVPSYFDNETELQSDDESEIILIVNDAEDNQDELNNITDNTAKNKEIENILLQNEQFWNHKVEKQSEKIYSLQKKLKMLRQQVCRRDAKILKMKNLINSLKENCKCKSSNNLSFIDKNKLSTFGLEFLQNELNNGSRGKNSKRYSAQMKQFASTLYYYSPKAYRYLRQKINLPLERTIRKIRANQSKLIPVD